MGLKRFAWLGLALLVFEWKWGCSRKSGNQTAGTPHRSLPRLREEARQPCRAYSFRPLKTTHTASLLPLKGTVPTRKDQLGKMPGDGHSEEPCKGHGGQIRIRQEQTSSGVREILRLAVQTVSSADNMTEEILEADDKSIALSGSRIAV